MKIALVHDDLVQWGGAERVLLGISEIFPDAPIYTSVYDGDNKPLSQLFGSRKVVTSFLQKIPGWKKLYKALLPLYPLAFEQFDFSGYDLVISHTTRFAKSIITKPQTLHICYCHTPPRFLWHFSGLGNYGLGEVLMTKLRVYDQVSAQRVDKFIAGSLNAERRIRKIYRRESQVVYPFVDLERFKGVEGFDGGYFVVVGRQNRYKRVDLAIKACQKIGMPLRIIGGVGVFDSLGTESSGRTSEVYNLVAQTRGGIQGGQGVEYLGSLDDEMVVRLLAGCKALIICAEEDFGLTSLEAQTLGKPVIAFKKGGALETVIENKTGVFFEEQTVESLYNTLIKLDSLKIRAEDCIINASRFGRKKFLREFKQAVDSLLYT